MVRKPASTHSERARERERERAQEKESERERKHVAPYRVFGGNVGAEGEQRGCSACQSECTRAHQQRLASLVHRIPLVPRINVHAGGHDGLQQHLDCCFVLLLHRQPNAAVARLNEIIG